MKAGRAFADARHVPGNFTSGTYGQALKLVNHIFLKMVVEDFLGGDDDSLGRLSNLSKLTVMKHLLILALGIPSDSGRTALWNWAGC
jgi:hypothetical protein